MRTFTIPASLKAEHEQLHARLVEVTRAGGLVAEAAREVAHRLHPHFVKEEEYALPPLGLLAELATGPVTADMADVLPMTRRLAADLPSMLAEHREIVAALEELRQHAERAGQAEHAAFADALIQHAKTEEEVLYPAALLVGQRVAAELKHTQASMA